MADALRAELWNSGVSIGVICPSSTDTGFQDRTIKQGAAQRRVRVRRHSAESVGRAIARMATSRRSEALLGVESKLMIFADAIAPRLVDWLLARTLTRRP